MSIKSLEDLFHHGLADIYYAEKKIENALPKMAKAASQEDLAQAFKTHQEETKTQIERLEKVFEICDMKKKSEKCEAIEGLIKEGEKLMDESEEGPVCDAALIMAAQKVEHYEISSYGTLCALAKELGYTEAASILHETLEEEENTDTKLTVLATTGGINDNAMLNEQAA